MTNDHVRQSTALRSSPDSADLADIDRALRIYRMCLAGLEDAIGSVPEPRDIKIIVDATGAAIESIRRIRGLDDPDDGNQSANDDAFEDSLAQRLEASGTSPTGHASALAPETGEGVVFARAGQST